MEEEDFIKVFKDEALELLGDLEDTLLELESNPNDSDLISAVFRIMHTVKGSAGMVGLNKISSFTHEVESILESVRSGDLKVNKGCIDYTLQSRDIILQMINDPEYVFDNEKIFFLDFKDAFKKEELVKPLTVLVKKTVVYRVYFKPIENIFFSGTNPLLMVNEVLDLGEGIVIPNYSGIPSFSDIETEHCYTSWEIYINTKENIDKIHDIFIFVEGTSIVQIDEWDIHKDESIPDKLGDFLLRTGHINKTDLQDALKEQHLLGEILINNKVTSEHEIKNALKAQSFIKKSKKNENSDSIRISSHKLDNLIDLVGEIVTIYAQLLLTSNNSKDNKLKTIIESFGLLTEELRNNSMSMRMLPIGSTFSRFRRLVRDLSLELNKKINLITKGAETELDKNVIEQLHDPLVHIIRNCIDHGIENPEIRKANGKDETGTITLSAIHAGSSVHIVIKDDGGGLNRKKIRDKAESKGILKKGDNISDSDLIHMIFAPGFSTAGSITKISGRGVGLDVVKRQIEELKGSVFLESEEGLYTQFTLVLPITLAIIEGLLVEIGNDSFVIPLASVEACVEIKDSEKDIDSGRSVITFRDKLVPYIDLRNFFNVKSKRNNIEQIVIINSNKTQIGFLVDRVVGGNQTVIKPLGSLYREVQEISGAAIMGNGSVALVIDIEQLIRAVEIKKEKTFGI